MTSCSWLFMYVPFTWIGWWRFYLDPHIVWSWRMYINLLALKAQQVGYPVVQCCPMVGVHGIYINRYQRSFAVSSWNLCANSASLICCLARQETQRSCCFLIWTDLGNSRCALLKTRFARNYGLAILLGGTVPRKGQINMYFLVKYWWCEYLGLPCILWERSKHEQCQQKQRVDLLMFIIHVRMMGSVSTRLWCFRILSHCLKGANPFLLVIISKR